jgi:hypothetical protein
LEARGTSPLLTLGGLSPKTQAWQIGAKIPPNSCLCCGRKFNKTDREMMGPYDDGPYRYVCRRCWSLPFAYFPGKELANCGECWLPPGRQRHRHFNVRDRMYPAHDGRSAAGWKKGPPVIPGAGKG